MIGRLLDWLRAPARAEPTDTHVSIGATKLNAQATRAEQQQMHEAAAHLDKNAMRVADLEATVRRFEERRRKVPEDLKRELAWRRGLANILQQRK